MGCQTILRYLESINGKKIGGIVLVAGWFELVELDEEEDRAVLQPWLDAPIHFSGVKQATQNITAIFSDNDEWVPLDKNVELFKKRLGAKVVIEQNKGHFGESSGVKELPSVLSALT